MSGLKRPLPQGAEPPPANDTARRAIGDTAPVMAIRPPSGTQMRLALPPRGGHAASLSRTSDAPRTAVMSSSSDPPHMAGGQHAPRQSRLDERLRNANLEVVVGDLLAADADYIVHQCNCRSRGRAEGVARQIFEQWHSADTYRTDPTDQHRAPGTVHIVRSRYSHGVLVPGVANLYAQDRAGPPSGAETAEQRLLWFREALVALAHRLGSAPTVCAFPYGIGCGLAGGDWPTYEQELRAWQCHHPNIAVQLYLAENKPAAPLPRAAASSSSSRPAVATSSSSRRTLHVIDD